MYYAYIRVEVLKMGNNMNGDRNGVNNFTSTSNGFSNNNSGFNLSNLFDLSKLGNLFNFGGQKRGNMSNNPLSQLGRMFGMNNRPRQYRSPVRVLPIEEAYRLVKSGQCFLLDVRTEMEYNTVRIKGSVNIPLDRLQMEIPQMVTNKNEYIMVYCATGARVRRAAQILWNLGYNNLHIWEGAGINTFAFADLILYNNRQTEQNSSSIGGNF